MVFASEKGICVTPLTGQQSFRVWREKEKDTLFKLKTSFYWTDHPFFCYNVGPRGPGNPGAQSDQLETI